MIISAHIEFLAARFCAAVMELGEEKEETHFTGHSYNLSVMIVDIVEGTERVRGKEKDTRVQERLISDAVNLEEIVIIEKADHVQDHLVLE